MDVLALLAAFWLLYGCNVIFSAFKFSELDYR